MTREECLQEALILAKKLSFHILKDIKPLCQGKQNGSQSQEEFLYNLLQKEYDKRLELRAKSRIKKAGFPQLMYLSDLQEAKLPKDARDRLPELKTLEFIRKGTNAVFYGNPGTGKTHLAIALAIEACMEDMVVLFVTIPQLLLWLKEAKTKKLLANFTRKFEKYDLVVCDEFGYTSCDKEGGETLFNLLSNRCSKKKSTIITTNLAFDRWKEVIKDKVLVAALIDRLTYKAHLLNMTGPSYRLEQTKKLNQQDSEK